MALTQVTGSGIGQVTDIKIGGSGSANTLNDYEEGTWTPILQGVTVAGSPSYTVQNGYYTKIGDTVNIVGAIQITSLGSADGHLRIYGLPFVAKNATYYRPSIYCGYGAGLGISAGASVGGWIPENTSYIRITYWSSAAGTSYGSEGAFSADGAIYFACTYQTD